MQRFQCSGSGLYSEEKVVYRRTIAGLFLFLGITAPPATVEAANHIEVTVTGCNMEPSPTPGIISRIPVNTPVTVHLILTSEETWAGATFPFLFYSPDLSITTIVHNGVVNHEPWGDIGWSVTGAWYSYDSWDGSLPDLICVGGLAGASGGLPPRNSFNFVDISFTTSSEEGVFCIDSAFVPPACEWVAITIFTEVEVTYGGGVDGYCFETFIPPDAPCTFVDPPWEIFTEACGGPAVHDFDASGPGPCLFSIVSGPGTMDANSGIFTVTEGDFPQGVTTVQTTIRVESQTGAGCEHTVSSTLASSFTTEEDNTTSLGLFRILVAEPFRPLMLDYAGYDGLDRLVSSVLYDPATKIGRSSYFSDDDECDIDGVPVGPAGTLIADSSFSLLPAGFEGPAGTREVHTELRSLRMEPPSGIGPTVRAGVEAPDQAISPGEVESHDPSGSPTSFFPAESFFNVFVEIDLPAGGNFPFPGGVLYNQVPILVVNDTIWRFPPKVVYLHDNPEAVKVYFKDNDPGGAWAADDFFGWLVLAGHGIDFDTGAAPVSPSGGAQLSDLELFMGVMETVAENCCFLAGDANGNASMNIADAIFIINRIFNDGTAPVCSDQADANGNNSFNIADAIHIINAIFNEGASPVCGTTRT